MEKDVSELKKNKYLEIAVDIAELVRKKNEAYGAAFEKSGIILEVLFPNGIKPSQYNKLLPVVRMIDKLVRVCNMEDSDPLEEDQFADIMGYALLAMYSSLKNRSAKDNEED